MSYDTQNIFAKILRKEIPANPVFEDEYVLAFNDIHPKAKIHVLIIPKNAYISFHDFIKDASSIEIEKFWNSIYTIAQKLDLEATGYRLITNHGKDAFQEVPHFHVHLLGGEPLYGF